MSLKWRLAMVFGLFMGLTLMVYWAVTWVLDGIAAHWPNRLY